MISSFSSFRPDKARRQHHGFSLIELLVVLGIVALLTGLAAPSIIASLAASKLNSASQLVADSIGLARQEAVTRDRNVQVRFYKRTSGSSQNWSALQILRVEQTASGSTLVAVTPVRAFSDGIIVSSTAALSPLLAADSSLQGTVTLPLYGSVTYAGFYFLPSGSTESALNTGNNFLTLQVATASGAPPTNYTTIQINPVTGKVITYRP